MKIGGRTLILARLALPALPPAANRHGPGARGREPRRQDRAFGPVFLPPRAGALPEAGAAAPKARRPPLELDRITEVASGRLPPLKRCRALEAPLPK